MDRVRSARQCGNRNTAFPSSPCFRLQHSCEHCEVKVETTTLLPYHLATLSTLYLIRELVGRQGNLR